MHKHPISRLLAAAVAIVGLSTLATLAQGSEPVEARCQGNNILAEIAASDPAAHARVRREGATVANAGALLWRIDKPGLAPSWLYGTVHLTDERVRISPAAQAAIAGSKRVALEIADLTPGAMLQAIGKMPQLIVYLDGQRLDGKISADELKKVQSVLAEAGLPAQLAPMVRPWLVTMLLSSTACERARMKAGKPVLDMRVAEAARAAGIGLASLEKVEDQLGAMAAIPEEQQLAILRANLALLHRTGDVVETVLQLYLAKDLGTIMPLQRLLAEQVGVPGSAYSGFESELLVKRNAKMRDAARPLLAQGGAFVAVGALHLVGAHGLVALLRQAGYEVTAVE